MHIDHSHLKIHLMFDIIKTQFQVLLIRAKKQDFIHMKTKTRNVLRMSVTETKMLHIFAVFITLLISVTTQALPSFARQTGQECSSCHIGGFGPQLTAFGRQFKIGGYTQKSVDDSVVPISAMLVGIYDQTSKDLPEDAVTPHFSTNNNMAVQEAAIFAAGRVSDHVGGFVQVTYSGIERKAAMDNLDLRYATSVTIADQSAIVGVSLNNNPTNQDPWNTVPAWAFPYMSAELAPHVNGAPLIAGGLSQQVVGLTTYMYWNDKIYAEVGLYRTQPTSLLVHTNVIGSVDEESEISGAAPYWRLTYNNAFDRQNVSVGLFGLRANIRPGAVAGPQDKYSDTGIDASYQFLGTGRHIVTLNASLINETQTLNATVDHAGADNANNKTNALNINGAYYFKNTFGVTLGYFKNSGSKQDFTLFAENPFDGSRVGHSDANGYIIQTDYTPFGKDDSWGSPFANVRLGLQYIIYNKFNGANNNYDGFGRNATDNNTVMFMIWTSI